MTHQPAEERQQELVERFCARAESLLSSASSFEEAEKIGNDLCEQFERKCTSALLAHATQDYMRNLLREIWTPDKNSADRKEHND
jgi:hypothetical protein